MLDSCDYAVNTEGHTVRRPVSSMMLFIRGNSLDVLRMPVHVKIQSDDISSTHLINLGISTEHTVCKHCMKSNYLNQKGKV